MDFRNLPAILRYQAQTLGPRPALRHKQHGLYRDVSWAAYHDAAEAAACALIAAGVRPGDRVGLLSENRVEWLVADMAVLAAGAVNVPPHAPLTARQVLYQLADAGVCFLIVSTPAQMDKIAQIRGELPALKGVVAFERAAAGPGVETWDGFLQKGRAARDNLRGEIAAREEKLGPDDLATVMYTSGTTGNPKGVMLTHGNLISNALASTAQEPNGPGDLKLTWLPFTHIYARTVDHYATMAAGVTVALAVSQETLVENLAEVQPTHFASVPRFYEKVLTAVAAADPAETGRRLRKVFGPRIDWMSSGGAPLPDAVAKAYHDAGLLLLQGYGLTESSPVVSFNCKAHNRLGSVGRAIPGVEVKIAADGEILMRGPHIMKGYWKLPEATAEAVRDGWLYTGDVGHLDADGYLFITGRKKEILVLSNGKKVAPSNLEGLIVGDPCVEQVVVLGEGRNYLTALLVPNWDNVRKALTESGVTLGGDACRNCREAAVVKLIEGRVRDALKDVSSMEQVRKLTLLPEPFSVAADEMTVSLKLRRNVILERHAAAVEAMYKE